MIEEELRDADADTSIDLVKWEADPNPKSFNPNSVKPKVPYLPTSKRGINFG